jgi:hypothetical protein
MYRHFHLTIESLDIQKNPFPLQTIHRIYSGKLDRDAPPPSHIVPPPVCMYVWFIVMLGKTNIKYCYVLNKISHNGYTIYIVN